MGLATLRVQEVHVVCYTGALSMCTVYHDGQFMCAIHVPTDDSVTAAHTVAHSSHQKQLTLTVPTQPAVS